MPTSTELQDLLDRLTRVRDNSETLVITTSGSTGEPKHVALRWPALEAAARASAQVIGTGDWMLALPTDYIAGVMVAVRAMVAGTEVHALESHHSGFAAAVHKMNQPRYLSLVPTQLHDLLSPEANPADRDALSSFECVLVGGQRIDPQLRKRAESANVRLVATYGSSELSGGCVYDGIPLPGVTLRVDEAGRLWVAASSLADGYVNEDGSPDTERTQQTFVTIDGVRWVRTDDLAELEDRNGQQFVRILGRADDVLVSGGVKLNVAEVQAALDERLAAGRSLAVAIPDERWGERLGVYVMTEGHNVDELKAWLVDTFGPQASAEIQSGPPLLNANGKADRARIVQVLTGT